MDDKLFIVGGRDGYKTLNSVECFNLNTKSWQSMPPLSTHRHGVGVVLLEGIFQNSNFQMFYFFGLLFRTTF